MLQNRSNAILLLYNYGKEASNYIVNLDVVVSAINDLLSSGEILSEP